MVNPLPIIDTIPTDTWVEATWEEFLTFADDPTLESGRFYYGYNVSPMVVKFLTDLNPTN